MLTDAQCRKARAAEKDYKLADAHGLYLYVTTSGFRSWRWKYRFGGKEKRLTLGPYPDVTLLMAREKRDEGRRLLREHRDPGVVRKQRRAAARSEAENTFEMIARTWHSANRPRWTEDHAADVLRSLERDVFPTLGAMPINSITPPLVLEVLRAIEERPSIDIAKRVRRRMSAVFVFAIASGLGEADPAAIVKGALQPLLKGRQPALTSLAEARRFLADSEAASAFAVTKLASRLLALTAVRPGVIREAVWAEFEGLETGEPIWRIPAARMKLLRDRKKREEFDFLVPLARQSVEVLEAVRRLSGRGSLVFPSLRSSAAPMSDNALGFFYKRLTAYRGRHVPHGWRSTFSTIMNERAIAMDRPGDRAIIDLMLAHFPTDVEGIYNRAAYLPRRRQLAQEWADLLMAGSAPAISLLPER